MEFALSTSPVIAVLDVAAFIARSFVQIFPFDLTRYVLGAGGVYLIVNLALSGLLASRKIRANSPGTAQMRREFLTSMRTVAIFAFTGAALIATGVEAGVISIDARVAERGWTYFVFNLAALIVLHDAWFYWTHRLIHDPRLFRRLHRTHHKSHNPSPWTAYSFDAGEALINALFLPLALFLIPSSGLAVMVFLAHMIIRNAVGHCGYEIFPARRNGTPLFGWLTTVTHHDLHHAQAGWNYGLYFSWWDRLMKTEHPLYHEKFAVAVKKPLHGSAVAAISPQTSL
ncbi:MAG: sterol desaturase family protein [Pseudomonadota bacterium]